ncbi:hypothetical protein A3736_03735 [Erythrobacter sp. HI0063]|nr:hypothetical protein A3736_03735 [Erythrobacter sp. HI0063]
MRESTIVAILVFDPRQLPLVKVVEGREVQKRKLHPNWCRLFPWRQRRSDGPGDISPSRDMMGFKVNRRERDLAVLPLHQLLGVILDIRTSRVVIAHDQPPIYVDRILSKVVVHHWIFQVVRLSTYFMMNDILRQHVRVQSTDIGLLVPTSGSVAYRDHEPERSISQRLSACA